MKTMKSNPLSTMTFEERVLNTVKRDIAEYNDMSRNYYLARGTEGTDSKLIAYYSGKAEAMYNHLLDCCWELGYSIEFFLEKDLATDISYRKAKLVD